MADKAPTTADMKHRVTVCTSSDVVTNSGGLVLTRTAAWDAWAKIEARRGSLFSRDGVVVREGREQQSHVIVIKVRPSIVISSAVWLYEARRVSPPRWFKILNRREIGSGDRYWEFSARLVESSDDLTAPATAAEAAATDPKSIFVPIPSGVKI